MSLTREIVRKHVIECLRQHLESGGQVEITEQTEPLLELGLDSADGLDFACELETRLDIKIPEKLNPFVNDSPRRGRSVGEIVDVLCELLTAKRG